MFFSEYSGVKPDIMVMAKGLANGFPLSAIVSRKEIMDKQKPGTMVGPCTEAPSDCLSADCSNCRVGRTRATRCRVPRQLQSQKHLLRRIFWRTSTLGELQSSSSLNCESRPDIVGFFR